MKPLILFISLILALTTTVGHGQPVLKDSTIVHTPPVFEENLDSLVNLWYVRPSATDLVLDSVPDIPETTLKKLPDSIYIERLANIESPIPFVFNSRVRAYIELYTIKRREQVEIMLGLSDYYFPMFEEQLDANNLPLELKYLPIIESALNPRAFSRAGASGLWQFMYYTGRQYGLEINSYLDERRDPYKSTLAAMKFLKDLHAIYNDWFLVIAAYNCGPGNVNKAIRRAGGQRDFWKIYYHLPRETRGYVPAFIAAAYTMTYADEHYLFAKEPNLPVVTDTILVNKPLHFEQVADLLNLKVSYLRDLNPQFRRDVIPAGKRSYPLRLDFDHATNFASLEDTIYQHQKTKYFSAGQTVVSPSKTDHPPVAPKGSEKLYYTVRSGDAVGLIAEWYGVRASDLRYWNNINRNLIRVGQKLVIYKPKGKAEKYKNINTMSYAEKQASIGKTVNTQAAQRKITTPLDDSYIYYTVRKGDNLWSIAEKYPGVSNKDIMSLNNLTEDDVKRISPGQQLKIKKKS
jgi:membrane-bound lytic murein transglycosylase D